MKKIIYLFALSIGAVGCSVDSLDSEQLTVADAQMKFNAQAETTYTGIENPGFDVVFFDLLQINNNNTINKGRVFITNDCDNLYIKVEGSSEANLGLYVDGDAYPTLNGNQNNVSPDLEYYKKDEPLEWEFSLDNFDVEAIDVFVNAGGHSWGGDKEWGNAKYFSYELQLDSCDECEESFNYSANEDGSYTFTYIPAEDLVSAEVVFTFAQSVVATGYEWPNWNGTSSTRTEIMDLVACEPYIWTVFLTPDCSGNSNNSNVWTDFKVNENSKKGDLENIRIACSI